MRWSPVVFAAASAVSFAGCKEQHAGSVEPTAFSVTLPETAPARGSGKKHGELDRATFNRVAVRLNLPVYWTIDSDRDGTIAPGEVASLLFYPTEGKLVENGAFTPAFEEAYERIVKSSKATPAGVTTPETERRKLVVEELDAASPTLVSNDLRTLSSEEKEFLRKMLVAAKDVDALFAIQNGSAELAKDVPADDPASASLFRRNWGPRCLTPKLEHEPKCSAIPGAPKPVVAVYPPALQKNEKFCEELEKRPDAKKLLDPFTAVRDRGGKLEAVSYAEQFREPMKKVADDLRAAADVLKDPTEANLKAYLAAAAQSFETNDWRASDEAWAKMSAVNSRWYVRVAPDETYWEPCSEKAGFHLMFARINVDSLAWQEKLSKVEQDMEVSMAKLLGSPYEARTVTFHLPDFIDVVLNAGDDRDAIGATIGQSLPNWGPIAESGRGRTVVMSNLYTDPDSMAVRRAKAEALFTRASLAALTDEPLPSLLSTILHEASHNLGPSHEYKYKGKTDTQAFGGDLASMLEELKAQSGALYYVDFLRQKGIFTLPLSQKTYADSIVWAMNHISRGMWSGDGKRKPYSQLAAIQMGFLIDEKALVWDPDATAANGADKGAFTIHYDKLPAAIEKLMKVVGTIKATNDRGAAEDLSKKYVDGDVVPQTIIAERLLRAPQPSFVYAIEL